MTTEQSKVTAAGGILPRERCNHYKPSRHRLLTLASKVLLLLALGACVEKAAATEPKLLRQTRVEEQRAVAAEESPEARANDRLKQAEEQFDKIKEDVKNLSKEQLIDMKIYKNSGWMSQAKLLLNTKVDGSKRTQSKRIESTLQDNGDFQYPSRKLDRVGKTTRPQLIAFLVVQLGNPALSKKDRKELALLLAKNCTKSEVDDASPELTVCVSETTELAGLTESTEPTGLTEVKQEQVKQEQLLTEVKQEQVKQEQLLAEVKNVCTTLKAENTTMKADVAKLKADLPDSEMVFESNESGNDVPVPVPVPDSEMVFESNESGNDSKLHVRRRLVEAAYYSFIAFNMILMCAVLVGISFAYQPTYQTI